MIGFKWSEVLVSAFTILLYDKLILWGIRLSEILSGFWFWAALGGVLVFILFLESFEEFLPGKGYWKQFGLRFVFLLFVLLLYFLLS